ncbi:MAG: carboxypeptidase regulatory-like domain-containing protein [Planctomycetes bacterium]|nr:carboxypeptidase regulatory-like domain-containing protein [Planctomycetota bacterium]
MPSTTALLQGAVLDTLGFRIVGADVRAPGGEGTRTDADGRFQFLLRQPTADLTVAANGHRAALLRAFAAMREPVVLALEPAAPWDPPLDAPPSPEPATLFGEGIVGDHAGKPLAAATVQVRETGELAITDELGRYKIALPAGPATLLCHVEGGPDGSGFSATAEPFQASRNRGIVPLPDLVVDRAAMLRGTVRDPVGQPVGGVPLRITGNGFRRFVTTTDNGSFRMSGLPLGNYELFVFAWRGACGNVQPVDIQDAVVDCDVQLRSTSSRRLQVVQENGTPVARAYVASSFAGLRRGIAQTDADGFASVQAVAESAEFEVRADGEWRSLPIRKFDPDGSRLVVAAP